MEDPSESSSSPVVIERDRKSNAIYVVPIDSNMYRRMSNFARMAQERLLGNQLSTISEASNESSRVGASGSRSWTRNLSSRGRTNTGNSATGSTSGRDDRSLVLSQPDNHETMGEEAKCPKAGDYNPPDVEQGHGTAGREGQGEPVATLTGAIDAVYPPGNTEIEEEGATTVTLTTVIV